jgi:hypothetical protein
MAQQAGQGSVAAACLECQAQGFYDDAPAGYFLLGLEFGEVQPRILVEVYGQECYAGLPGNPRRRLDLPHRHSRQGLSRFPAGLMFAVEWQAETRACRRIFSHR